MARGNAIAKTVEKPQTTQAWDDLLAIASHQGARIVIESGGVPVMALIPAEDLRRLLELEAEREADFSILDEVGRAFEDVTPDEIERQVAQALESVRHNPPKRMNHAVAPE